MDYGKQKTGEQTRHHGVQQTTPGTARLNTTYHSKERTNIQQGFQTYIEDAHLTGEYTSQCRKQYRSGHSQSGRE